VSLWQLVAFVPYQVRVAAGLGVLAANFAGNVKQELAR
jgi:uncharacterized protein YciW